MPFFFKDLKTVPSPYLFFYVIYALLLVALMPVSGTNPRSRLALQSSLCESLPHLKIDYTLNLEQASPLTKAWTIDWSKTPEGNYYSNKAPGPSFLALPFHCPLYWLSTRGIKDPAERIAKHFSSLYFVEIFLSLCLQVLPLILFSFYFLKDQNALKVQSRPGFFLVSLFFGTTASLYMNSWFGHGLPALLFLGTLLSYLKNRWFYFGFFLGWLHLSDYGSVYILLPLIALVLFDPTHSAKEKLRAAIFTFLGALIPALLWIHYHTTSFGGILSLPQKFQNPDFVDNLAEQGNLSAVMNFFPTQEAIVGLIFGTKRGLLITQPWIFGMLFFPLLHWKKLNLQDKRAYFFVTLSFLALFWMNASFGQWHSGSAAGPRYLSSCLLAFPILLFRMYSHLRRWEKLFLSVGLVLSLVLFMMVQSTSVIPQPDPLWPALWNIAETKGKTFILRFSLYVFGFGVIATSWAKAFNCNKASGTKHAIS